MRRAAASPASPPPGGLGALVRRRRVAAGLTVRDAARRIGISPSYLIAIEQARNPTTGRAPMPSASILAAIGRALDVDLAALLAAAGATGAVPAHVLLYQLGTAAAAPLAAARTLFAGEVDGWLEAREPAADDVFEALDDVVAEAARSSLPPRLGVVFGAGSRRLRSAGDPGRVIASEESWAADVAARFRAAFGRAPVANVCVYRADVLDELAPRLDRLATIVRLVRAHEAVVVVGERGELQTGPAATEAILRDARPAGVGPETWQALAAAAAAGFARAVAVPA